MKLMQYRNQWRSEAQYRPGSTIKVPLLAPLKFEKNL